MSEPKKHHYLPVFYLSAWANQQGNVCEFSRPHKEVKYKWRHPSATGYEENLYSFPGVPREQAQLVEKHYLGLVDSTAATVHQKFLLDYHDDLVPEEALAWARFLYAMMFRNPEQIASIQDRYRAFAPGLVEEFRERYPRVRTAPFPESFDEFKEQFLANPFNTSGIHVIPRMLSSGRVIDEIHKFRFWTCRLRSLASPTFLTSDRPITMTDGLNKADSHIVMPLSPHILFVAARGDWLYDQVRAMPNDKLAKMVNEKVTRQSHKLVYGADASQHLFVSRRLGQKLASTPLG